MSYNNILVDFTGAPQSSNSTDTSRFLTLEKANPVYVNQSGDFMTGDLNMKGYHISNISNPVKDQDAVSKFYVDEINKQIRKEGIKKERLPSEFNSFSMNNLKITNLGSPTEDGDAVNKKYVDQMANKLDIKPLSSENLKFIEYGKIVQFFSPKFWISSFYNEMVDISQNGIKERTGAIQKIDGYFQFKSSDYVISNFKFKQEYTFIGLVKARTPGRIFSSLTGNKLFGFWKYFMNVAWHDEHIFGLIPVSIRMPTKYNAIQLIIYICSNTQKQIGLYSEGKVVFNAVDSNSNTNSNWGNFVIGDTTFQEQAEFDLYECICFDKKLDDTTIDKIRKILIR